MAGAILAACLACGPALAENRLDVVVTIAPVHSLVAGVMEGVGEPALLLQGGASAHSYAMKPSDAKRLQQADIVIQVSPAYEAFLQKALKTLPKGARIVTLEDIKGLDLLPVREGGEFEEDAHEGHGHKHGGHGHGHGHGDKEAGHAQGEDGHDVHIWLDPVLAQKMVAHIADALAEAAPQHAAAFKANAEKVVARLKALDEELAASLKPSGGKAFIVFHDVMQYFEKRYGLASAGAITLSPERQPSARRLKQIRAKIERLGAACVFSEPQFSPKLVETVIEGTRARKGSLDEIGAGLAPGPELYFALMRRNAEALAACLAPGA
jgi:zinc transport system substrate-binding protein